MSDLPTIDRAALLDRLDAELRAVGGPAHAAIATDGDGTLWGGDVCEEFFAVVLSEERIGEGAREALENEARSHRVHVERDAPPLAIAHALMSAYRAGAYPEDRVCAMMAWSVAGMRVDEVHAMGARVLRQQFPLADHLQRETLDVLGWAHAHDVPTWLVSASPHAIVCAAAEIVAAVADVPVPKVLAMTPATRDGVVLPSIEGAYTYGPGKAVALDRALAGTSRALLLAMGDNSFDADMLRMAKVRVAVRPKRALIDVASKVPGLLRLLP